jgi:hypothetical protein
MGEEKPDEELMGKRKSSPRLSTASLDADDYIFAPFAGIIHGLKDFFCKHFIDAWAVEFWRDRLY